MSVTYILDPSVLLHDPFAIERLQKPGVAVILPRCTIEELGQKTISPTLGSAARRALEWLDDLREQHPDLREYVELSNGVFFRIEKNNEPASKNVTTVDRVISVAKWAAVNDITHGPVMIWAKDVVCRLRASSEGLPADDPTLSAVEVAALSQDSGQAEMEITPEQMEEFYAKNGLRDDLGHQENTSLLLTSGTASALARVVGGAVRPLQYTEKGARVKNLRLASAEQKFAWDMLSDPDLGIVSLGGTAGAGKTALSLAAGIQAIHDNDTPQERIVVLRPTYAVGGRGIGFLPGSEEAKMEPWSAAVKDAMHAFSPDDRLYENLINRDQLEIAPLDYLRGRSFHNSFVIVDEAQNLESNVLLTALTRIGRGSRVVLTHDVSQLDNLHVGKYDGITALVHEMRGLPQFGHLTMRRSERSQIANIVATRLARFAF